MEQTVKACRQRQVIPTYVPKDPSSLPMFFEKKPYQGASGRLYPLPYCEDVYKRQGEDDDGVLVHPPLFQHPHQPLQVFVQAADTAIIVGQVGPPVGVRLIQDHQVVGHPGVPVPLGVAVGGHIAVLVVLVVRLEIGHEDVYKRQCPP